jgi:FkbM family methyltransferase|tara:strand:+ start:1322 stop:1894 length:573 start_codon:yes stop_codon:yes gene_type:complete
MITKRISQGGPAEYQDDVRDAAYNYVTDFDVALDIGANVGFWARPLTKKFKQVIAYEPMPQVLECLELNIKDLPVTINKYALGKTENTVNMIYDSVNTGNSHVDEDTFGSGNITVKRLDDLDVPKFGLVKIDCERHELPILEGAIQTILKYKPIVIVEQHADTEYCAGEFLKKHGAKELTNVRRDYIFGW